MFIVHKALNNKDLVNNLITLIRSQPLKNMFAKEHFLIQNSGMERWLSQQLAQQFKVWAHYQFFLPSQFFKSFSQNKTVIDKDCLLWQLEQQLYHLDNKHFEPLRHYLQGNNKNLKRYQLAKQIAQLFINYQDFRPELLSAWRQGYSQTENNAESWQRELWLKINQTTFNSLDNDAITKFKPERLIIFGLSHLTPLQLDDLQMLAQHSEIHLFLQNPLSSIIRLQQGELHPLITSLGQQGLEFQQLLLDKVSFKCENNSIKKQSINNNLQQLQSDLSTLPLKNSPLKIDNSLLVHACHSRVREVEVLKNLLLSSLETQPNLAWRDIIIVAPNIQHYTPFIAGVFDDIPHRINGQDLIAAPPLLAVFIQFLKLISSRFEWQEVLDLLNHPHVFPHFSLSEADLTYIKHWLTKTHVRWGKSVNHKQQLGLPPLNENTWQASMDRLLMGYAFASDETFVDGILPYHQLEGTSAQALGGLNDFMQLLFKASEALVTGKSFKEWGELFYHYAQCLFIDNPASQTLYTFLVDFDKKFNSTAEQVIELTVITRWLEDSINIQKTGNGLLRGQLTFSSINAVRGIPFKVIAILGMNEGDFPSLEPTLSFNLLTTEPKLGDPSKRNEDRQQFLELLLAAEQQLIITYIGQSQHQHQLIPPSVVISELLDVMAQNYQCNKLLIKHPLQAFSHRYFDQKHPSLLSYSTTNAEIAQALSQKKNSGENWWQGSRVVDKSRVIELDEVRKFYRHPQRYFIRHQLGVNFKNETVETMIEAREPFSVEGLAAYSINHDWINSLLQQKNFSLAKLQAQGRWLSGVLGEIEFNKQQPEIVNFIIKIQALKLGKPLDNLAIDINLGERRLIGKLYNRYQQGSLFYRYAPLKGKDLMLALLHHCLINQIEPQLTYIVTQDETLTLTSEHQTIEILQTLLQFYFKGLERPNALFVNIALDYVKQSDKQEKSNRNLQPALKLAQDKLKLSIEASYEMEIQRLYGNSENLTDVLSGDFIIFCEKFLKPIWKSLVR
jgi:exodeoxyribonuclease V gamma subunit